MKSIPDIIQGDEETLFNRVYSSLEHLGCSRKGLKEFEGHRNDDVEEMIDVSCDFLSACGCWG
jgi:hypothetical protein